MAKLKPGSTIGIFGGGQLGKMLCEAAQNIGFRTHIFDSHAKTPASQVSGALTCAPYEDMAAIELFATSCDVITYEFENIPLPAIEQAKNFTNVFPPIKALEISGDRLTEKTFLQNQVGAPVVEFANITSIEDMTLAIKEFGYPCILKTRRFGYDGKGQVKFTSHHDMKSGFSRLGEADIILEKYAPFVREFSSVAARGQDGNIACYPLAENVHKNHRLHTSTAPANDPQNVKGKAQAITKRILEKLDYVGIIGIEFFELSGGEIIVNEIAPRVHNSGHWTMDANCTDQFEQHIRAITGLPLGEPTPNCQVVMTNLIGEDIFQKETLTAQPETYVHDYGKTEVRADRKMGHVNRVIRSIW
ncbi:MAG: 5-(carboxyamino)imidazole ribonucleotide synthase [Robiginitomaculum sp.]